ncbi:unnamed protein product [Clonostachys rhizophaga]|uniref:2-dehydropantoate 2-reductase n=1 Tax=Clonostachys rhizophaga TaxID=160324 RepID=A0A9N9VFH5_9HYPO|nr:unnamed protein product [Clonostachys rhizophaga]
MAKSRVLVVGMGGIGTVCAYGLEIGGLAEVTSMMRSNYAAATEKGIDIESVDFGHVKSWKPTHIIRSVPDVSVQGISPFDFILVATKNVPDVAPSIIDVVSPAVTVGTTTIVLAQNGLNIEMPFIDRFPTNPILSSVVYTAAEEISPAKIHHTDPDWQKIGPYYSPHVPAEVVEKSAEKFVKILDPEGKRKIFYDADVSGARWRKLAYNASFNSVAAALQMDTSRLRMSQHLIDDLVLPIILEVQAAAASCGVTLQSDLVHSVMQQDMADSFYRPSMMQDFINRNFMEIETIVGEPLREGKRHGIAMPTLSVVYGILRGLQLRIKEEKGLWQPKYGPGNPYM